MLTSPPCHLLKSTALAVAAVTLAKTIGFVREMVIAAFFGAGAVSDAFILAFTIPDILLSFIAASVVSGFIPIFHRVKDKTAFTHNVMTMLLILGLAISAVFSFYPDVLVRLFAFRMEAEAFALAQFFVRYMIWVSPAILLTGIYTARLEISGDFFSAGIRTVWRNVVIISGVIFGTIMQDFLIIALFAVVGELVCMLSLSVGCRKRGYIFRPLWNPRSPDLRMLLMLMAPLLLSNTLTEVNRIVDRNLAASLGMGAISSLNYAAKLIGLFVALIGTPLMTVFFPHLSELAAKGNLDKLKIDLLHGMVCALMITVPVCIGVVVLSEPGVRIVFQRGSFTAENTLGTAACLRMYAPLVIVSSVSSLLLRAFFAIQDTKAPAKITMASALVNIALNFFLVRFFGVEGLALAASISGTITMMLLFFFLRRKLGGLGLRAYWPELVKILVASLVVGSLIWFLLGYLPLMSVTVLQSFLLCIMVILIALVFYAGLLSLMKSKMAYEAYAILVKLIMQGKR